MAEIIKAMPTPVNRDALIDELLQGGFPEFSFRELDLTIYNVTDDTPTNDAIDAILVAHDANILTDIQSEASFLDAAEAAIRTAYADDMTYNAAILSIQTLLNNHPSHKSIMNTVEWQRARDIHGIAITIGNILGNVQAEAIYWQLFLDYVARLKILRL